MNDKLKRASRALGFIKLWMFLEVSGAFIYFVFSVSNTVSVLILVLECAVLIFIPIAIYRFAQSSYDVLYELVNPESNKEKRTSVMFTKEVVENEEPIEIIPDIIYDKELVIQDGIKAIKPKEYSFHKEIVKVIIPESVVAIAKEGFYGCSNLDTVIIKRKGIVKIGINGFGKNHPNLKILVNPDDIESYMSDPNWEQFAEYIWPNDEE